jgi:opacity protein-like surface antigen
MAGVSYQVSERVIFDAGYRYIDFGKAESSHVDSSGFTGNPAFRVDDLTAHEFKVGLRYYFGGGAAPLK